MTTSAWASGVAADSVRSPNGNSAPIQRQNWRACDEPLHPISRVRKLRILSLEHARDFRLAVGGQASGRAYQSPFTVVGQTP